MKFQALVHDRTFDLELAGDTLTVDGAPADFALRRITSNEVHLLLDGRSLTFTVEPQENGVTRLTHHGRNLDVRLKTERELLLASLGMETGSAAAASELKAPMPGLVLSVLVEPGQQVEAGEGLVVLEAMKMENELRAHSAATVAAVHVAPGAAVGKNDLLVSFAE